MKVATPENSLIKQRIVPQHQRITSLRARRASRGSAFIMKSGSNKIIAQFKKLSNIFLCMKSLLVT